MRRLRLEGRAGHERRQRGDEVGGGHFGYRLIAPELGYRPRYIFDAAIFFCNCTMP